MKKLLILIAAISAPVLARAGSGTFYDSNGNYSNWYSTPYGGSGWDSQGNYYNWYSGSQGGSGWDSRGNYYNWYYQN
jgi:hypothetical protein